MDFKEVYKWIMSPLLAKKLDVYANLDGTFLINVNYSERKANSELNEALVID